LIAAALVEQKRRGARPAAVHAPARKQQVVETHLTTGKLNAVRAAFKAGVKSTQIARQFGLSDADVRKALASDEKKR
jgi:transposase-like protein